MSAKGQSALARYQASDLDAAESMAQAAVQDDPNDAAAWHLLGLVANRRERLDDAIRCIGRAARLDPDLPEVHLHAADFLRRAERLDDAQSAAAEALRREPNSARALNNLGLILQDHNRPSDAARRFQKAIDNDPSYVRAYHNLAILRHKSGDTAGAVPVLREAVRRQPDYLRAWHALASFLAELGATEEAIQLLQQAVRRFPDSVELHDQLGRLFDQRKEYGAAVDAYRRAVALRPPWADAHHRLGVAQRYNEQLGAAIKSLRRSLELNPNLAEARATLAYISAEVCDWRDRDRIFSQVRTDVRERLAAGNASPVGASVSSALPFTPAERLAIARSAAREIETQAARSGGRLPSRPIPQARERIRLAYLSSDLRNHPVGHLMGPLLEHHDREQFSVTVYSHGKDDASPYRRRIETAVERFVDMKAATDFEIAQRIHDDRINLLVEFNGYTVGGRPAVLAHRPAPVQISYLGFQGAMGARFVDYLIADSTAVPPEEAQHYTERLIYMPPSYMAATDHAASPDLPARSEQSLPERGVVFCGFNNSSKIDPQLFDVWMQILERVPDSVLWLRSNWRVPGVANLRREAGSRGVDPDRLIFANKEPEKADHLARQRLADLFLDTPLYNAHVTAMDALSADVPVITCRGNTFTGRGAASMLMGLGLSELIVEDLQHYQELAVELATDQEALANVKRKLASARAQSDLFNPASFVRKLESALTSVWHNHLAGKLPRPLSVDKLAPPAPASARMHDSESVDLRRIDALVEIGNLPLAESLTRQALEDYPGDGGLWTRLATIAERVGLTEFAEACHKRAEVCGHDSGLSVSAIMPVKSLPRRDMAEAHYLLIKAWGFGFFSDVYHVLGQLLLAELTDRQPIVHWGQNSLFTDRSGQNAFEFFFEPLSELNVSDLASQDHDYFPRKWNPENLTQENLNKW